MTNNEKVKHFMQVMGQEIKLSPELPDDKTMDLRLRLIEEEFEELKDAARNNDMVEVADALTDLLYVIYGAGWSAGIDLDRCFDEVHRSNMSKIQSDGTVLKNEFGKVIKPSTYSPPDLASVLTTMNDMRTRSHGS